MAQAPDGLLRRKREGRPIASYFAGCAAASRLKRSFTSTNHTRTMPKSMANKTKKVGSLICILCALTPILPLTGGGNAIVPPPARPVNRRIPTSRQAFVRYLRGAAAPTVTVLSRTSGAVCNITDEVGRYWAGTPRHRRFPVVRRACSTRCGNAAGSGTTACAPNAPTSAGYADSSSPTTSAILATWARLKSRRS